MERAECVGADPEVFFDYRRSAEALRYCNGCEVIKQCRRWAKKTNAYGIYGGRGMWLPKPEPEPQWTTKPPRPDRRRRSAMEGLSSEERRAVFEARRERINETARLRRAQRTPEQRERECEAKRQQWRARQKELQE